MFSIVGDRVNLPRDLHVFQFSPSTADSTSGFSKNGSISLLTVVTGKTTEQQSRLFTMLAYPKAHQVVHDILSHKDLLG
jgi:hypothetical protein